MQLLVSCPEHEGIRSFRAGNPVSIHSLQIYLTVLGCLFKTICKASSAFYRWVHGFHLVVSCQKHEGIYSLRACDLLCVHALKVHLVVICCLVSIPMPLMRLRQPVQCNACKGTTGSTLPHVTNIARSLASNQRIAILSGIAAVAKLSCAVCQWGRDHMMHCGVRTLLVRLNPRNAPSRSTGSWARW